MLDKKQPRHTQKLAAAQWAKVQQRRDAHAEQDAEPEHENLSLTGVPMKQLIPQAWMLYRQLVGRGFISAPDLDLNSGEAYKKAGFDLHQQIIQLTIVLESIDQQSLW